jgi:3',5'-cyclic AMP phosphodiesterase CpdA
MKIMFLRSFRRRRFDVCQFLLGLGVWLLLAGVAWSQEATPYFFIQITDPQFGKYTQNADFRQETANFEFAIATANRLKPVFVIVTGDMINKPGDKAQLDEYFRIAAKLDHSIHLYNVPGNHDVGDHPTPASIAAYTARFGPEYYRFRERDLTGLVLDSNLIFDPAGAPEQAKKQETWVKSELEKARKEKVPHLVVFQHHPWFLVSTLEPDAVFNLPRAARMRYLDLFGQCGVSHVFTGHLHINLIVNSGPVELVTTCSLGKPRGKDQSGLRIVTVRPSGIEHRYYEMGEMPNEIKLSPGKRRQKAELQQAAP